MKLRNILVVFSLIIATFFSFNLVRAAPPTGGTITGIYCDGYGFYSLGSTCPPGQDPQPSGGIIFETNFTNDSLFDATNQSGSWSAVQSTAPEGFEGALIEGNGRIYGIAGGGIGGTNALKFDWDADLGQPVTQLYKHLTGDNTTGYTDVYVRYTLRLPDNFKMGNPSIDDIPYWKFGRLWQNTRVSEPNGAGGGWTENRVDSGYAVWNFGGTATYGVDAGATFAAATGSNLSLGSAGGERYSNDYYIGTGDYSTHPGHWDAVGQGDWAFNPNTRLLVNTPQTWHTIEWRFKLASSPTANDGIFQMWFDGVEQVPVDIGPGGGAPELGDLLPTEMPTAPIAPSNGYNMLVVFDNMTFINKVWDEVGVEGGIYVSDIVVATERIGHNYVAKPYTGN